MAIENAQAAVDKSAVPVGGPIQTRVSIRYAGKYSLWVRIGQPTASSQCPLNAQLVRGETTVLEGPLNHDGGKPGAGGPAGYADYRAKAPRNSARGTVGDPELTQRSGLPEGHKLESDKDVENFTDEFLGDVRNGTGENWGNTARVDKVVKEFPFYWWKIGEAKLDKGEYALRVRQQRATDSASTPQIDAAILTTYDKLVYPYTGDITAPRASYIRFWIDKLPKDGLEISADVNTHAGPFYRTPAFHVNPSGLSEKKVERHTRNGWTRWYCLQDVQRMPGLNGQEVTLHLMTPAAVAASGARGATQFSVFPHGDAAVRTIGWDEPDGLLISMQPNFEDNPHLLRTVRDHAREHYELALAAAGDQMHPLTRGGELSFTNSWGAALGEDYEYLVKTMRLLGFNSMGIPQPLRSRNNYGGMTAQGSSWDATFLPYDDDKAKRQYEDHFREVFKTADPELWKGANTFQICDEPSEFLREEFTAPLWRFEDNDKNGGGRGGRWADLSGGSDLHTRSSELSNCVVEGKIVPLSGWVGFRVGIDKADVPTRYAYWKVGKVAPNNMPENLAVGKVGFPGVGSAPTYILRPSASLGTSEASFKIIYEGSRAALYLNDQLVHEHKDLPPRSGLGIFGPAKAITALQIRQIKKSERLSVDFQATDELVPGERKAEPAEELEEVDPAAKPAVSKPLKPFVEDEWVQAGGIPEAHVGFRKWAAARGLKPESFGQKSWDDVRMLTVRALVRNPQEARLYYWSRRYSGYLTPRMFSLAAQGVRASAPNKEMVSFVGLSGHSLYFPSEMPLDMFEMGNQGYPLMPGISDWMFYGGWGSGWDSHQVVAFSVAPFNAGARRWTPDGRSAPPASFPMMHCVSPNLIRSYTMLANQVKFISYFAFGPYYAVPADFWSESPSCYSVTSLTDNRAASVDDILAPARMRPSRVAMLYALSTEYWAPQSSFADRRAAFLGLSHAYFQPELVTEDQIEAGALSHYDALYVMDPCVAGAVQSTIAGWVKDGGLLWSSADALTRDEFNQPLDGLNALANIQRKFTEAKKSQAADAMAPAPVMTPVKGELDFSAQTVATAGMPEQVIADGARVRARYEMGAPAWIERGIGKGRVVYLAHRAGLTHTSKSSHVRGLPEIWSDTGLAPLVTPLIEAKVDRELVLSQPNVMASPMTSTDGTVVILYNMRAEPVKNLVIQLHEPAKPISVQAFAGFELVNVPFDYRDGSAFITLADLDREQMVLVRRKPAPPDPRLEEMRARTVAELDSKDAESLSAGAWFAGFYPDWKLSAKLLPLLRHERWQVRRSAAESLGRLGDPSAVESLISAMRSEKDSNALGEMMLALGRLHHPDVPKWSIDSLAHDDPMVRTLAVRAALAYLKSKGPESGGNAGLPAAALMQIATAALADSNHRVRREGISLIANLNPAKAVESSAAAFNDPGVRATQDRPDWTQAIATNDDLLAEYVRQREPGGDELLLALAALRQNPAFVAPIDARLIELDKSWPGKVAAVAITQRDPSLARHFFEKRANLRPETAEFATHVMEHTFSAQLGGVISDWEQWLKANPK